MNSAIKLIDVITESYDKYNSGVYEANRRAGKATYCNLFINDVFKQFNYKEFQGMLANQIADVIQSQSSNYFEMDNFQEVYLFQTATFLANAGALVVAFQQGTVHGHVCIIRPSEMVFSKKWQCHVPKVANIGKTNFIGKGLNWAFAKKPRMACLVSSMT